LAGHWRRVPEPLTELLEACLHERPEQRLADFGAVLQRLAALGGPAPPPARQTAPAIPVAVALDDFTPVEPLRPRREERRRRAFEEEEEDRERRRAEARRREEREAQERRRQRGRLPRWLSAVLGAVYMTLTLGVGMAVDLSSQGRGSPIGAGIFAGVLSGGLG